MQKLIKKLQIKDGQKGQLLNSPDNHKKRLPAWPALRFRKKEYVK